MELCGFCAASWGCQDHGKCVSGYLFKVIEETVCYGWSWVCCCLICFGSRLRNILGVLGFLQRAPTIIYEDNPSSIAIAKNYMTKSRTKRTSRFDILSLEKWLMLKNWFTDLMLANALTKYLAQVKFTTFVHAILLEDRRLDQSGRLEEHDAAWSRSDQ